MYVINSNYFFCCSDIINLSRVSTFGHFGLFSSSIRSENIVETLCCAKAAARLRCISITELSLT